MVLRCQSASYEPLERTSKARSGARRARIWESKTKRMMPVTKSDGRLSARHSHSAFYHHLSNPSLCCSPFSIKKICAARIVALRIHINPPLCPPAPLSPLAALVLASRESRHPPLNVNATVLINQMHRKSALPVHLCN
jgi:ribosomal protein L32